MTRKGFLAAAAGVVTTLAAWAAAQAQTPPTPPRGEIGSARHLKYVREKLHDLIGQLYGDRRDYGGYRVKAIAAMEQARADLDQALQWDATHPH